MLEGGPLLLSNSLVQGVGPTAAEEAPEEGALPRMAVAGH